MKQTIRFIAIVVLSAAIAFGMACVVLAITDSEKAFVFTYILVAVFAAMSMGVFDVKEKKSGKYESIRHRSGIKYNQAAIFIGTACVFMGTPEQCDEVADDLWHWGQQARVDKVTEETVFNVL